MLTIVGMYATELRDYPRTTAGWLMVPATLTMASTTFLTTWFHRRSLRHVWLVVGVVGTAACVWWLSSLDNFTPKEHVALILACWGAFLGLIPPVFLTDEIEGLNPKDFLYAGALAVVGLVVPIITVPTATGTMIKAWSDRALDTYRLNLSTNRPAVSEAADRVADYYQQRGLSGPALQQETGIVLGDIRHGRERRLRFPRGPALPEPDDAGAGAAGCAAALVVGQRIGTRRPGPVTPETRAAICKARKSQKRGASNYQAHWRHRK